MRTCGVFLGAKLESRIAIWEKGTVVCVSRLAARGLAMARAMGIGELLGPLRVGEVIRIRLDEDRALMPTILTRIESVRPDVVRIDTQNHRYELRRVHAAPSTSGVFAIHDDLTADSEQDHSYETQIVQVDDWPETSPDRFESGARVKVTHERDGERRELGMAILLTDLVPGDVASFADSAGVTGTSEILEIIQLEKRTLEIVTSNSKYRLELLPASEEE